MASLVLCRPFSISVAEDVEDRAAAAITTLTGTTAIFEQIMLIDARATRIKVSN